MSATLLSEEATKRQNLQLLTLKHGQNRVMVSRRGPYNFMLNTASKHFPSIPRHVVTLQTNELDVCEGHYVDITAEIWTDVIDLLDVVEVTERVVTEQNSCKVTIKLVFPSGEIQTTEISTEMPVDKLIADANQTLMGTSGDGSTKIMALHSKDGRLGGLVMSGNRSIGSYNIKDGDSIILKVRTTSRCRKPVIYLYSPSDIDVSVKLSLIPEWSLSVIYPVVATEDHGQRLEWNVRTHQDGSLTEHNSGLDVSYLFWEAETNSQAFTRSPAFKPQPVDTFSPISSSVDDMDSIVIPVDRATVYLDKSLKVLGLHTEARTSFITYWLPSIRKHEYIALRFVPQAAYERAASLSISPHPDVVTRVCMLFRGISKEHLANWSNAQMQAEKDVVWWVDVVGVDPARASDATLFRVLEWGGMEVLI
ncbi:hypothetical protein BDR03DRAFT_399966 [Suillus americanus]|nr:hypothetical protein BDR03DRAFT_399966 [Suillus americanus]